MAAMQSSRPPSPLRQTQSQHGPDGSEPPPPQQQTQQQQQQQRFTGSRQYKSRRNRPCDLCRARKVACAIETQPPCELCRAKNRSCTFVNGPTSRTRPNRSSITVAVSRDESGLPQLLDAPPQHLDHADHELPPGRPHDVDEDGLAGEPHHHEFMDMDGVSPTQNVIFANYEFPLDGYDPLQLHDSDVHMGAMFGPYDAPPHLSMSFTVATDGGPGDDSGLVSPMAQNAHPGLPSVVHQVLGPAGQPPLRPDTPIDDAREESVQISLEHRPSKSYRFVGPCGELDTYLLAKRRYNSDIQSNSPYTTMLYQAMVPLQPTAPDFRPSPVFTVESSARLVDAEPKLELEPLTQLRSRFKSLISNSFARGLMRIFFRFVGPSFPILSETQVPATDAEVDQIPLSFVAAICCNTLQFIIYDDELCIQEPHAPPAVDLWRIAWTALQLEINDVHIAAVQAALLILQRQTREELFAEASFNWRLCSMLLANGQTLGLNHDPSRWFILPAWERRLRKRIWWAIVVTESWTAFGQGMPSHINMEDSDVPLLVADDLIKEDGGSGIPHHDMLPESSQFYHLVNLTLILRDIHSAFYTVKTMNATTGDLKLALSTAKPLRARLRQWHEDLPLKLRLNMHHQPPHNVDAMQTEGRQMDDLNSSGSLRLAYLAAQVSIFRALLRPLALATITAQHLSEQPSFWESDAAVAVVQGALSCGRELIRFIEGLNAADWDSFWYSWSKHNFAISSTFLMHLLVLTSPSGNVSVEGFSPYSNCNSNVSSAAAAAAAAAAGPLLSSPSSSGSPDTGIKPHFTNHFFVHEHAELQTLTKRWRWALRLAERGSGGRRGLMGGSLRRIEALFTEWQIGKGDANHNHRILESNGAI